MYASLSKNLYSLVPTPKVMICLLPNSSSGAGLAMTRVVVSGIPIGGICARAAVAPTIAARATIIVNLAPVANVCFIVDISRCSLYVIAIQKQGRFKNRHSRD
jgi:hypothetical protein